MYKLEYLPAALEDMVEIVRYLGGGLDNPLAARRLAVKLVEAGERMREFPYANPAYIPLRPLGHEYRELPVQNYLLLYWVDEEEKRITVARVVYAKQASGRLLA